MAIKGVATLAGTILLIAMMLASTTISQTPSTVESETESTSTTISLNSQDEGVDGGEGGMRLDQSSQQSATGRGNSDLIIYSISASWTSAAAGDSKSVSVRVKNQGTASSGSFYWGIYLSTDTTINTNDIELDTWYRSSLSSGSTTSTMYKTVTIPTTISGGRYYIGAFADTNTQVSETNENNNGDYDSGRATIDEAPDLTGRSCSAPSTGVVGDYLDSSISLSIENDPGGSYIDSSGSFYWAMYLSSDSTITSSDDQVGSDQYKSSINGGSWSSDSLSTSNRIPSNINPGTYYWGFIVDVRTDVVEQSETNNAYTCSGTIVIEDDLPDLVADNVGTSSSSVVMGDTISVSYRIDNDGHDYSGSFYWKLYLSTDRTITSNDVYVDEFSQSSISPGSYTSGTKYSVQIPTGINSGYYYLGMIADNRGGVTELDETNNVVADTGRINVLEQADLEPASPSGPTTASTGDSVSLNWRIDNLGDDASGWFYWKAYLSTDSTITSSDTLLGSSNYASSINGGSSRSGQLSVTIPSSLSAGVYYWGVIADTSNYVTEGDETNNAVSGNSIQITVPSYDLRADSISVDQSTTTICTEESVTINMQASNIGTANAGSHYYEVLFSQNGVSGSWISIGHAIGGSGSSYSQQVSGQIPASMGAANYYVRLFVDSQNHISESSESNNVYTSTTRELTVVDCTPDFTPISLTGPTDVLAGQTVTLSYSFENSGAGGASNFPVDFFLSRDTNIDTADTFLGAVTINTIGATDTISDTIDVTIPSSIPPGCWYYGIFVDINDVIPELDENDNERESAGQVCIIQPNLRILSVSSPGPSQLGETIQVSVTMTNDGGANAGRHQLAIVAEIITPTGQPEYFLEMMNITSLAPGANLEVTRTVTLPTSPAGTYRIFAVADYARVIAESDESDNNGYGAQFEVSAPENDLVANWITGPTTAEPGQTITVEWMIENLGGEGRAFDIEVWLSDDTTLDSNDWIIHSASVANLDGASSLSQNTSIQLSNDDNGTWWTILVVDSSDQHQEDNEGNNIAISANPLIVSEDVPPPVTEEGNGCDDAATDGEGMGDAAGAQASATRLDSDSGSVTLEGCLMGIDNDDWFSIILHGGKRIGVSFEGEGEPLTIELLNGTTIMDNGTLSPETKRTNLQLINPDSSEFSRIYHIRIHKLSSEPGGAYTLKVIIVDASEVPDMEPPEKPVFTPMEEWVDGDEVTITWSESNDVGSAGIAHYEVRFANGFWSGFAENEATLNISSLADGRHSLEVRAVDNAGNPSLSDTMWLRIDRHAPTLSVSQLSAQYAGPPVLQVSLQLSDGDGSGISTIEWSWDNHSWQPYPIGGAIIWSNWSELDLYVRATDNVGLQATTNMTIEPPTNPNEPTTDGTTTSSANGGGATAGGVATIVLIALAVLGAAFYGIYLIFQVNRPGEDDEEFDENEESPPEASQTGDAPREPDEASRTGDAPREPTEASDQTTAPNPSSEFNEGGATLGGEVVHVVGHEGLPPGGQYDTSTGVTWYVLGDGSRWWMLEDGSFKLDETSIPRVETVEG